MEENFHQYCNNLQEATELVISKINDELNKLDVDVSALNDQVNCHHVEINEGQSQKKATDLQLLELACCLEVLEERGALCEGVFQSLQEEVKKLWDETINTGEGSPYQLWPGMLTNELEGLFESPPQSESELSYFTPQTVVGGHSRGYN